MPVPILRSWWHSLFWCPVASKTGRKKRSPTSQNYRQLDFRLVQGSRTWWLSLLASRATFTPSNIWFISFWGIWSIRKTRLRHATDFWISFPFKSLRFRSSGERFGSIENFRNSSSDFSAVRLFWILKIEMLSPKKIDERKKKQIGWMFYCIISRNFSKCVILKHFLLFLRKNHLSSG